MWMAEFDRTIKQRVRFISSHPGWFSFSHEAAWLSSTGRDGKWNRNPWLRLWKHRHPPLHTQLATSGQSKVTIQYTHWNNTIRALISDLCKCLIWQRILNLCGIQILNYCLKTWINYIHVLSQTWKGKNINFICIFVMQVHAWFLKLSNKNL